MFVLSGSVALLADLIPNFGDALTAFPLGFAFSCPAFRAGLPRACSSCSTIFVSACVALYETIQRLIHPEALTHLWALATAGLSASSATRSPRRCACEEDAA